MAGKRVGSLGPVHPDVGEAFEIGEHAVVVEFDLEALEAVGAGAARFLPLPRFPASARDLSLVVRDDVAAGDVEHAAREAAGELAEEVSLFDRFVGGNVPAGHASLALHVVYRAPDRTLTDADVDVAPCPGGRRAREAFRGEPAGGVMTPANRGTIVGPWPTRSPARPARSPAPCCRAGGA